MAERFDDEGRRLWEFTDLYLVHCPRCERRAWAVRNEGENGTRAAARLTCLWCGFARQRDPAPRCISSEPVDGLFGLPLWLQTPCRGHVL